MCRKRLHLVLKQASAFMPELRRQIMRLLPDAANSGDFISTPALYQRLLRLFAEPPTIKTVGRRPKRTSVR